MHVRALHNVQACTIHDIRCKIVVVHGPRTRTERSIVGVRATTTRVSTVHTGARHRVNVSPAVGCAVFLAVFGPLRSRSSYTCWRSPRVQEKRSLKKGYAKPAVRVPVFRRGLLTLSFPRRDGIDRRRHATTPG